METKKLKATENTIRNGDDVTKTAHISLTWTSSWNFTIFFVAKLFTHVFLSWQWYMHTSSVAKTMCAHFFWCKNCSCTLFLSQKWFMDNFFVAKTIYAHFFVAKIIWAHLFCCKNDLHTLFLSQKLFMPFFVTKRIYAYFFCRKNDLHAFLSRKRFTHFVRKVFARWKLPSGKFRFFSQLSTIMAI